ncbi:uncharacterized protein LAESUDRAFT_71692 [Laetiporus sulphureus 93-53]|uniref:Uncharacterized protein n=1 Tax=Laetiporus sulphureus 93-53 TaxID=1314785 RepID=A0A165AW72_9APHY|nr:uncharacterized protein LAESUDRAFT_71692 [Laetiporus sulphureus 93-53]KZS99775.1 hypothetical protein LAESUDRAFT_71692 [Laetiporus sulphureus 93-53]
MSHKRMRSGSNSGMQCRCSHRHQHRRLPCVGRKSHVSPLLWPLIWPTIVGISFMWPFVLSTGRGCSGNRRARKKGCGITDDPFERFQEDRGARRKHSKMENRQMEEDLRVTQRKHHRDVRTRERRNKANAEGVPR